METQAEYPSRNQRQETPAQTPTYPIATRNLPLDDLTLQLDHLGHLPAIRTLSFLGSRCKVLEQISP